MPAYGFASFEDRERDVREAAARWADRGLAIRFGVEVTYERAYEDQIRGWLGATPTTTSSARCTSAPTSPYKASNVAAFVGRPLAGGDRRPYFDEIIGAARSGLFDTIGHLDFVKRYLVPHVMPARARGGARSCTSRCSPRSSRRARRWRSTRPGCGSCPRETYPAPHIVARYRELGGSARDHRQRRPPNRVVRIRARGGVSSRDARGV